MIKAMMKKGGQKVAEHWLQYGCGKLFCWIVLLCFLCNSALAQQAVAKAGFKELKGIVVNDKGEPLEGISVKLKATGIFDVTLKDGSFRLTGVPEKMKTPVLQFTGSGYENREVVVKDINQIRIVLTNKSVELESVVVIGYGDVRKKDLTGAVGTVDMKDLEKAPVKTVDEALAGRIAGVQVISPDGQPGSNAVVTVRGVGSVTQNSAPLYVIDGFPQEDANFNSINPAEVESIQVLKDASSTAIYGARGSNGVIIITTKRGKSPKPQINYNGFGGVQSVIKKMRLMNAYEFVRMQNEINPLYANQAYFTNNKTLEDYKNAPTIDWQDLCFNDRPVSQNHNLSVSLKNNKTAFVMSGSYVDQMGLIIKSGFKRYQGRITLDQDINDHLKVGVNVNYAYTKSYGKIPATQTQPTGSASNNASFNYMYNLWSFRPAFSSNNINDDWVYDELGDFDVTQGGIPGDNRINPYISTNNEINDRFRTTLNANGYGEYKFSNALRLRVTVGLTSQADRDETFNNSKTLSGSPLTTYGQTFGVTGSINNQKFTSLLNENTLTYNKSISANHQVRAMIGYTVQKNEYSNYYFMATNLINEAIGIAGVGQGTPYRVTSGASKNAMQSYLARVNYTWRKNFLFTASIRADGSSKFDPSNRWGYFPSGAFAWRFGNENFMKRVRFLNDAKLRFSYGATGNNRVSDFAYLSLMTTGTSSFYSFNESNVYAITTGSMSNKNLKWETGRQFDAGINLALLNDRVVIDIDYYKRITDNLLLNAAMPYSTGFTSAFQNIGKVSNEGLELSLNTTNVKTKHFSWSTSFNISFNKNRVEALTGGEEARLTTRSFDGAMSTANYIAKVGRPVAMFYGFIADGNYQFSDFTKVPNSTGVWYVLNDGVPYYGAANTMAAPNTNATAVIQPGDAKYKDLNGDGILNSDDYTTIGNPYPIHIGGFTNNFTFRNFDLNVFFQWSYGNDIINANRIKLEGGNSAPRSTNAITGANAGPINLNMAEAYVNRWTPTNPSNEFVRVNAMALGTRQYSSKIIEDGSYLRLKTVSLGYTLPISLIKKLRLNTARFYVSAQNLFTWTKYKGTDPEVSTYSDNNLTPGFDFSPYPRTKVITLGTNISF